MNNNSPPTGWDGFVGEVRPWMPRVTLIPGQYIYHDTTLYYIVGHYMVSTGPTFEVLPGMVVERSGAPMSALDKGGRQ